MNLSESPHMDVLHIANSDVIYRARLSTIEFQQAFSPIDSEKFRRNYKPRDFDKKPAPTFRQIIFAPVFFLWLFLSLLLYLLYSGAIFAGHFPSVGEWIVDGHMAVLLGIVVAMLIVSAVVGWSIAWRLASTLR